jgi:hypothetical protein
MSLKPGDQARTAGKYICTTCKDDSAELNPGDTLPPCQNCGDSAEWALPSRIVERGRGTLTVRRLGGGTMSAQRKGSVTMSAQRHGGGAMSVQRGGGGKLEVRRGGSVGMQPRKEHDRPEQTDVDDAAE